MSGAVALGMPAPEFTLADFDGRQVSLSDYRGARHVVLVFNRGFT
jgi:peroxiredoxin